MSSSAQTMPTLRLPRTGLSLASLAKACVFLTIASGAVVFTEPAPYDLLMLGACVALVLSGLLTLNRPLVLKLGLWGVCAAGAFLASTLSLEVGRSATHTAVSLYLCLTSVLLAGFVAHNPAAHTRLVLRAYLFAALLAAAAGIAGYFAASELLTKFGRASGTFKDPNVFAAFLVPAILYVVHAALARPLSRVILPAAAAAILALALLLSFSRGAWINLAVAFSGYVYLRFVTAPANVFRLRIAALVIGAALAAGVIVTAALRIDGTAALFAERSSLAQSYDVGPEGRFGGHLKAWAVLQDNPLGIGPLQFAPTYHTEDVHNVYLSMFLGAGWLGGCAYLAIAALTLALGFSRGLRATPTRPEQLLAYAAFLGLVVEGAIVDTDHWRHFYVLLAIVWGLMGVGGVSPAPSRRDRCAAGTGSL